MCMLLGFSSNKKYELKNVFKHFFSCSTKHPDGWGLALYENAAPLIIKEPVPAYKSNILDNLCNSSIPSKLAIAHIRRKTYGNISFLNTHPFVQRINSEDWIFAHNGSVDSFYFKKLESNPSGPSGDTDSEKISCFIADRLRNLSKGADIKDKTKCIEDAITLLSKFGKLNLLITNGSLLFVHTNCAGTLYINNPAPEASLFCTSPVMLKAGWERVPLNRLHVYENGIKIYEGKEHGNEFIQAQSFKNTADMFCWR